MNNPQPNQETLDPDDWETVRKLAHRTVDDAINALSKVREQPVWQSIPKEISKSFKRPMPLEPGGLDATYQEFMQTIFPYPMGNTHPRFWAWFMGNGTMTGALADFLAAIMNPNLGGGNHAANLVEAQVVNWCKQMVAFPEDASGLLVSGGSMANFVGLAVARNAMAEHDVREHGVPKNMAIYSSVEVHSCNDKAIEILGLGRSAFRKIPTNQRYQIDIEALIKIINEDRNAGLSPFCVIGNAGTINTGSVDDLDALAKLCKKEKLWYHVDGAIGAVLTLAPNNKHLVKGMENADSIALDLHKWMHVPFEAGCVLIRDEQKHRETFCLTPEYLEHTERGLAGGKTWFSDYGLQLSRGFRALKVWFTIKEHGIKKFGRLIDQNIEQAHCLVKLINATLELELTAPVVLNIVCFRFKPSGLDEEALNKINQELLVQLHERGIVVPSYTTLNGKYCLRAAITNHRTQFDDLQLSIDEIRDTGNRILNTWV